MKPLAVLTLALFLAAPVQGSSFCYVGIPEVPEAYAKARAVFIGEVIKIDRPVTVDMGAPIADRLFRVTFKVEYSWKGAGFQELGLPEVVVLSDQNQAGRCWSWGVFLEGRKYLVYANETSDKNLIVGVGNRTAYLGKASEDLEKLRKLNALLTLRPIRRATSSKVALKQEPDTVAKTKSAVGMSQLLRFPTSVKRDPAIEVWMFEHKNELGAIAQRWFEVMRNCGDDVRELLHDGHPTACVGDAAFAYVNAFKAHVNVGFFRGAEIADPECLLQGTGKFMRHVKLRSECDVDDAALMKLVETAYDDMKRRLENVLVRARL